MKYDARACHFNMDTVAFGVVKVLPSITTCWRTIRVAHPGFAVAAIQEDRMMK